MTGSLCDEVAGVADGASVLDATRKARIFVPTLCYQRDLSAFGGCRMCMVACPFGAVAYIADHRHTFKCDLCDGDPLCVRYCEPQALTFEIPAQTSLNRRRKVGLEMVDARTKTLQALQSAGQ